MRHGSLFSGIGGFDLAAEWMGWENVFHCEWMEFPRKVLDYHFPNADSHIDICKTDFKKYANTIDILTGGFPCQPFSLAGKRKGTDDERYLWGEMLRAIQEIKPRFVIAENVFGITNIDGGLVFEQVCLDLENEGYEVQPFIIPAAAKNAPHRRDRCWFIGVRNATDNNGIIRREGWESQPRKQSRHGESNESCNTEIDDVAQNPLFSRCLHGESNQERAEVRKFGDIGTRSADGIYLSKGDATDTNGDGLSKQWRYDSSRQINARSNASFKWSANTKNFDNGNTSTNLSGQSTVDGGIGEQANGETNQLTTAKGICGVDKKCDQCKGIIRNDRCENVNCRALVQDGYERIQSSEHRGMDKNCGDISSDGTNEWKDDGTNINRMDGDATNSNSIGIKTREIGAILEQPNTKREATRFINVALQGDAMYTNSTIRKGKHIGQKREREFNRPNSRFGINDFKNFPTQSPVCGGDDGLPTNLDGITFPKWRAESIKGYGNAIVPQIAYQLFEIINDL